MATTIVCTRILQGCQQTLKDIRDWYVEDKHTNIFIYSLNTILQLLTIYIPNRLILQEIATNLATISKRVWPTFPIELCMYVLQMVPHSRVEANELEELWLTPRTFKRNNPMCIVKDHYQKVKYRLYQHDKSPYHFV